MQLDALTASTVLVLVQLCVALIMAGVFTATPSEKCTRYWALSGLSVALGVLLAVANAGALRYVVLIAGNNAIILGLVLQWCGIRAFYRKPGGWVAWTGWAIAAVFFVLFCWLLARGAPVYDRALLVAAGILLLLVFNFGEILSGQAGRHSFASRLALAAIAMLAAAYLFRLVASLLQFAELLPRTNTTMSITVLYLVPIAGSILLTSALLLLYFERIVEDKNYMATHDDLTGLLNRRAIVSCGERELAVAQRLSRPMAVAYLDIDHFKQINDGRGHEAGDRAIAGVAQVLREHCRGIDLVGRYGGDEFCIVFPGLDSDSLTLIGERLTDAIRRHRFGNGFSVTVSIGLAALPAGDGDCTWSKLMQRADRELYKAKSTGRNRYAVAGTERMAASC